MFETVGMAYDKSAAADKVPAIEAKRHMAVWVNVVVVVSVIYPMTIIFYAFVGGVALQLGASLAGAFVFFIMLFKETRISGLQRVVLVLMILSLSLWGWYGAFWTNMRSYGAILILLSCLGIAWAALEFRIGKFVYEYPFIVFLLITIFLILKGTDQYEFNEVLEVGSRNVYSAILLALAIGYLLSRRIRGEYASSLLGVALVVVSFFLYSRTGLALSFVLFFCFLANSKIGSALRLIPVLCIMACMLLPIFFDVGEFLARNSNFEKGVDSTRFSIWKAYLDDLDMFSLLFGYDMSQNEIIAEHGGNPHSAYFRIHSYFGFGLLFLMMFISFSALELLKEKEWFLFFMVLCFLFRAAFDPVYFVGVFDYAFYPFVFYAFFKGYLPRQTPG